MRGHVLDTLSCRPTRRESARPPPDSETWRPRVRAFQTSQAHARAHTCPTRQLSNASLG